MSYIKFLELIIVPIIHNDYQNEDFNQKLHLQSFLLLFILRTTKMIEHDYEVKLYYIKL